MKRDYIQCKGCGRKLQFTWYHAKKQYARMIERGATVEQAKAASPRCQKCTTKWLRERGL